MAYDPHKNFAYSTVATAPSPATSGTSLVVQAATGANFPAVPFNATVWPSGVQPLASNAEIVRVTAISTDTFTITRTQESTSARTIVVGDQIVAGITAKTMTDLENHLGELLKSTNTTGVGSITTSQVTVGTLTNVPVVGLGRDVELELNIPQITSSVSGDRVAIQFLEGATVLQQYYLGLPQNGWSGILKATVPAPSAGNHTYTVKVARDVGSGTVQLYADASGANLQFVAKGI